MEIIGMSFGPIGGDKDIRDKDVGEGITIARIENVHAWHAHAAQFDGFTSLA
jgi:hypothetical protein